MIAGEDSVGLGQLLDGASIVCFDAASVWKLDRPAGFGKR
jgi:hypothetical protein